MKILVVSSFLPYPLHSGGHVRLYNLMSELSDKHEITLVCEKRPNQTTDDIRELEKICKKVITVDRRRQWTVKNILKSAASAHSFLINGHTHQKMKHFIKKELESEKYDLIHIETFYVMQNLPATTTPKVLVEHNIEYQVYKKYMQKAPVFLKPFLAIDIAKIKKEEEKFWLSADRLVAVSEEDRKVMNEKGLDVEIVPNGVDTQKFSFQPKIKDQRTKKILFVGDFKWIQNRDAIKFIIEEIWPEIRSKIKDQRSKIKLWVIGRKIPDSIKSLSSDPDVLFDEESANWETEKIFQEADVLLAPIRVGGGTSYKILESMSCGTPVVTTTMSADAISAKTGKDLMVGDSASDLADKTVLLLEDQKLYEEIGKNGRILIEKNYKWKEIAKKLDGVYKDVRHKM